MFKHLVKLTILMIVIDSLDVVALSNEHALDQACSSMRKLSGNNFFRTQFRLVCSETNF